MLGIFILTLLSVRSKYISQYITLSPSEPWVYLTKFAAFSGQSLYDIKVKLHTPLPVSEPPLVLKNTVYIEERFLEAYSQQTCTLKETVSRQHQFISIPNNGSWSSPIRGSTHQRSPHYWYFALSNCKIEKSFKIKVEFQIFNSEDSQFSAEDEGIQYLFSLIFLLYLLVFYKNFRRMIKHFNKTDEMPGQFLMINISIASVLMGTAAEILHIWIYTYNGQGFFLLDAIYNILEVFAQLIATMLMIVMADGWTIKYKEFPDSVTFIPIGFLITVSSIVISAVGRVSQDQFYRDSEYEGVPGFLHVLFRVGLWMWFLWLSSKFYMEAREKRKAFMAYFICLGSAYFLSIPVCLGISWWFERYLRKKVMIIGLNGLQIVVFYFLTYLFGENSEFYKISTLSEGVLPGKGR